MYKKKIIKNPVKGLNVFLKIVGCLSLCFLCLHVSLLEIAMSPGHARSWNLFLTFFPGLSCKTIRVLETRVLRITYL